MCDTKFGESIVATRIGSVAFVCFSGWARFIHLEKIGSIFMIMHMAKATYTLASHCFLWKFPQHAYIFLRTISMRANYASTAAAHRLMNGAEKANDSVANNNKTRIVFTTLHRCNIAIIGMRYAPNIIHTAQVFNVHLRACERSVRLPYVSNLGMLLMKSDRFASHVRCECIICIFRNTNYTQYI